MSKASRFQFRRDEERIEVTVASNVLDPSSPILIEARRWDSTQLVTRREARGAKAARNAVRELLTELQRDGFVEVQEDWTRPQEPPSEPMYHGVVCSWQQAQDLAAAAFSDVPNFDEVDEVDLYEGTLEIFGDLHVEGALFIQGDLVVHGDLTEEYGAILLVTGSVRCRSARLSGSVTCEGTFAADEYIDACSSNDYAMSVGRLVAKVFLERGMATLVGTMDAVVWRTMNQVTSSVNGQSVDYPKIPREAMGDEALRALALSDDALAELREIIGR